MTKRFAVLLLVAALLLAPSSVLAQCKYECTSGVDDDNQAFAHCWEHLDNRMWDMNTCDEVTRCSVFFGGRACWPECQGEWCYLV